MISVASLRTKGAESSLQAHSAAYRRAYDLATNEVQRAALRLRLDAADSANPT